MGGYVSDLLYMLLYNAGLQKRKIQKLVRINVRHIHAMDFRILVYNGVDDHSDR